MPIGETIPANLDLDLDLDLDGLTAAAAPWLAQLPVSDQRIQVTPDSRTVRYYQSTGLLDRPTRYDGRVAKYGRRHLLQLLAVRVLQSQGLSLAQVQAGLSGATDSELLKRLEAGLTGSTTTQSAPRLPPVSAALARPVASQGLTAVELSPGVVVTVDSRFHPDPARVIETLRRAIQGEET